VARIFLASLRILSGEIFGVTGHHEFYPQPRLGLTGIQKICLYGVFAEGGYNTTSMIFGATEINSWSGVAAHLTPRMLSTD
jgi:hypothetical protein